MHHPPHKKPTKFAKKLAAFRALANCQACSLTGKAIGVSSLEQLKRQVLKWRYAKGWGFTRNKRSAAYFKKIQAWVCSNFVQKIFRAHGSRNPEMRLAPPAGQQPSIERQVTYMCMVFRNFAWH
jgi:hypothetical protein